VNNQTYEELVLRVKQQEEELRKLHAEKAAQFNPQYDNTLCYQTLFENALDGIFILNEKGNVVSVNQSYAKMHGYTVAELLNMNLYDIDILMDRKSIPERLQKIINGEAMRMELDHYHKNGSIITLDVSACAFKSKNENFIVAFHQDITQKKKVEQKMQMQNIVSIIKGEESERARISQELHDGLGPQMSTLKILMQGMQRMEDTEKMKIFAQKAQLVLDEIFQTITEVSNNLSPYILRQFGLFVGLKTFIEKISKNSEITFVFDYDYKQFQDKICPKTSERCKLSESFEDIYEISLYRIITELINNSLKHSKASEITIKIFKKDHAIHVLYSDNGIGFDSDSVLKENKGLGLRNMQNRVKNINGTIRFNHENTQGFSVEIVANCICKQLTISNLK